LGLAYSALGETRKAIEYYEQALAIAREIGDRRREGNYLGNLGNAYQALGAVRKSIECYEQTLGVHRDIGYRRGEGDALGNLGIAYLASGELERATRTLEDGATIAEDTENLPALAAIRHNLAKALASQQRFDKAAPNASKALRIARDLDLSQETTHSARLGLWITLDWAAQRFGSEDAAGALEVFSRVQDIIPYLPDAVLAGEMLRRYVAGLLVEHGVAAREHLLAALGQVGLWGRPELEVRLRPAAAALECEDGDAWTRQAATLPPVERAAASVVWDAMTAGHELQAADKFIAEGNPQEALQRIDEFLARRPADVRALALTFQASEAAGDADAFVARLAAALERAPNDAGLHKFAGEHLARFGRHTDAVGYLEHAVALDADDAETRALLGRQFCRLKRFVQAEGAFAAAIGLDEDQEHPEWRLELAETRLLTGNVTGADQSLRAFDREAAAPPYRIVHHYLRTYSALVRHDPKAASREVSEFANCWLAAPERIEVTWGLDDLLAAASQTMSELDVTLLRDLELVIRGEKPMAPFALAYGEAGGAERTLAALSASGAATLRRLETGLVTGLRDIGLHAGGAAATEAFFEALERQYTRLSETARHAADAILLETIPGGGTAEKLMALRTGGAHLLDFAAETRDTVVREMLARAADSNETSDVRDLAVRLLTIAYYDLPELAQAQIERSLRHTSQSFAPPALLEFLSDL